MVFPSNLGTMNGPQNLLQAPNWLLTRRLFPSMLGLRLVAFLLAAFSIAGCGVTPVSGPSIEPGWGAEMTSVSHRRPTIQARRPVEKPVKEARVPISPTEVAGKPFSKEWYAAEAEQDRKLRRKLITCRGC
jgi:hypothetical protein